MESHCYCSSSCAGLEQNSTRLCCVSLSLKSGRHRLILKTPPPQVEFLKQLAEQDDLKEVLHKLGVIAAEVLDCGSFRSVCVCVCTTAS